MKSSLYKNVLKSLLQEIIFTYFMKGNSKKNPLTFFTTIFRPKNGTFEMQILFWPWKPCLNFSYTVLLFFFEFIRAWKFHIVSSLSFPLYNENLNSFLTRWGNYSRRGIYSREETIWGNTVHKAGLAGNHFKGLTWVLFSFTELSAATVYRM